MQTEQMLRLLRKDETSPSGYRIVGYKWHLKETPESFITILWSEILVICKPMLWSSIKMISYNAFELGVKVDDEWWFEGDIIRFKDYCNSVLEGILALEDGCFWAKTNIGNFLLRECYDKEYIGNIHESR